LKGAASSEQCRGWRSIIAGSGDGAVMLVVVMRVVQEKINSPCVTQ
jgi:hypothetical protein